MAYGEPSTLARYWKPIVGGLVLGAISLLVIFWNLGDDTLGNGIDPVVAAAAKNQSSTQLQNRGTRGNTDPVGPKDSPNISTGSNSTSITPWTPGSGNQTSPSGASNGATSDSDEEDSDEDSSEDDASENTPERGGRWTKFGWEPFGGSTNGGSTNGANTSGSSGIPSNGAPSNGATSGPSASSNSNSGGSKTSVSPSPARDENSPDKAVEVASPRKSDPGAWSNSEEGWAEALRMGLSFGGHGSGAVTFAPSGSPFAAVGGTVWNLEQNTEVGTYNVFRQDFDVAAINQNGRVVAVNETFFKDGITVCGVGELSKLGSADDSDRFRKLVEELAKMGGQNWIRSPYRDSKVTYLRFAGPSTLVAAYTKGTECRIVEYDLTTNDPIAEISCEPFEGRNATLDSDGVYMAFAGKSSIRVIDLQKRKTVSTLRPPKRESKEGAPKTPSEFSCQGLDFSPDGEMLAALLEGGTRLVVWKGTSELLIDQDLDLKFSPTYVGPRLVWIPDGAGWILHGQYLIDRETRTVLWELKSQSADPFSDLRFVNQEHVVVQRAEVGGRTLSRVPVPWIKIAGSLKALRRKEPAYLAPGVSIGLDVTADKLRVTAKSKVESEIERIIGARLRDSQIPIRRGEKGVVMKATYVETEGEPVRAGLKAGSPTVRGDLTLELVANGHDGPLWAATLTAEAPLDELRKPASETLALFDLLAGQLKAESIPRYIPKDRTLANLPLVSEF